nr:MAG TPA: hypothetical protein [Caudoviricetes sp.]
MKALLYLLLLCCKNICTLHNKPIDFIATINRLKNGWCSEYGISKGV